MDITAILTSNYPEAQWVLTGEEYSGLTWLSEGEAPTEEDLEAQWPQVEYQLAYAAVELTRKAAYSETSDPIFFEYQRGTKTEQEWLDAVEAVKDAHPYPTK
jgi:hypothetical protein